MNVPVYLDPLYLWNLTTNFDIIWHEVHPYTDSESWKVSKNSIHKQNFFTNTAIFPTSVRMSEYVPMSDKCPDLCPIVKMSGFVSLLIWNRYLTRVAGLSGEF